MSRNLRSKVAAVTPLVSEYFSSGSKTITSRKTTKPSEKQSKNQEENPALPQEPPAKIPRRRGKTKSSEPVVEGEVDSEKLEEQPPAKVPRKRGKTKSSEPATEIKTDLATNKRVKKGTSLENVSKQGEDRKKKIGDIEDMVSEPPNWKEALTHIRQMRANEIAPVDTMGCDQCAEPGAAPETQRLHHLLSLMLSSQTKDQVTFAAMARLRQIPSGLTIETLLTLPEEEIGKIIYPVGFYKTKAKNIKLVCKQLKEKFNGDIPDSVDGLCSLPGVGPKMAHLCMQAAWGVVSGIGVDTHVHRIANRLGWVKNTKTPEKTRTELEAWLPKELWREVNHLLVGLGQTVCKPVQPNCDHCLANGICPSAGKEKKKKK